MRTLFVLFFFMSFSLLKAEVINIGQDNKSWILKTKSSVYHLYVSNTGELKMDFFGNKNYQPGLCRYNLGPEITVRGGFSVNTPMLEVIFNDGVRAIDLEYVGSEIKDVDGCSTLIVSQKDRYYPLYIKEYIRVLPEYDIIEKWLEIKNSDRKSSIIIENAKSGTFFIPKGGYELTHFSGVWGNEFMPNKTLLTQGIKTIQVKDFRSFGSSFFVINNSEKDIASENTECWYGSLQYSGNWKLDFEKYFTGEVQITAGINYWDQSIDLRPGKSLITPKFVIGYTSSGLESVSLNMSRYTREQIMHDKHREMVRPVLYNSWYATTFNVNEEHQLELAKIAKQIGVETFVIDDGWFKGRVDDKAGLGDWTVDKNKFPNGLKPLIKKINDIGLNFGIWIEPEMVNPNSDLYRIHPDWVLSYPNRTLHTGRNQLILNLGREDVYQYLYKSISTLLRENNITYIKWDMNRALADPGFPKDNNREVRDVRIKYVDNLYRLIKELRKEFPNVWFENCASGGGRVDLGIMQYTDFNWVSDNTDPIDRIFIQDAYLTAFPANSMISWVTHEDWHRQNPSLEFKFDVAMAGVLGIGYDITKWSESEKELAKKKIAQYKQIRETVNFGDLYHLSSPYETNRSILQYVNKSGNESVLFIYNLAEYVKSPLLESDMSNYIKLRGLDKDAIYRIDGFDVDYTGKMLMDLGIDLSLGGAFKSRIIRIVKL